MSDDTSKPAGGSQPPFSAQDAMAFMQKMWNPFAMPMPGSAAGGVTPSDPPPAKAEAPSQPGPEHAAAALPGLMGSVMPGMMPFPNPGGSGAQDQRASRDRRLAANEPQHDADEHQDARIAARVARSAACGARARFAKEGFEAPQGLKGL
jgi:hypothetical protein